MNRQEGGDGDRGTSKFFSEVGKALSEPAAVSGGARRGDLWSSARAALDDWGQALEACRSCPVKSFVPATGALCAQVGRERCGGWRWPSAGGGQPARRPLHPHCVQRAGQRGTRLYYCPVCPVRVQGIGTKFATWSSASSDCRQDAPTPPTLPKRRRETSSYRIQLPQPNTQGENSRARPCFLHSNHEKTREEVRRIPPTDARLAPPTTSPTRRPSQGQRRACIGLR